MKKIYKKNPVNRVNLIKIMVQTIMVLTFFLCFAQAFAQTPVVLNGTHITYNPTTHTITGFYYEANVSPVDIIIPREIEYATGSFDVIKVIGNNVFSLLRANVCADGIKRHAHHV